MKKPKLSAAGKAEWKQIEELGDVTDAQPLLTKLCLVADRLAEIRAILERDGLLSANGRKHPLLDVEARLMAQYGIFWKLLGLADDDAPKRAPGRPAESERR
jgi:hypothetical protein